MTTAQRLFNEGRQEGIWQGQIVGLLEGIEVAIDIRFGQSGLKLMNKINTITDLDKLEEIKNAIRKFDKIEEIEKLI